MKRKIAILRGINVGGKRKVLMNDLKLICDKLGLKSVQTYIQSGNLIFDSDKLNTKLEGMLEEAMVNSFGFDVPVIVRNAQELQNVIETNPFSNGNDIERLHLTFLKETPQKQDNEKIQGVSCEPDQFKIEDKHVFVFCAGKYHESKLTNNFFEKKLNVGATTRNWKTVLKISELSKIYV